MGGGGGMVPWPPIVTPLPLINTAPSHATNPLSHLQSTGIDGAIAKSSINGP